MPYAGSRCWLRAGPATALLTTAAEYRSERGHAHNDSQSGAHRISPKPCQGKGAENRLTRVLQNNINPACRTPQPITQPKTPVNQAPAGPSRP